MTERRQNVSPKGGVVTRCVRCKKPGRGRIINTTPVGWKRIGVLNGQLCALCEKCQ